VLLAKICFSLTLNISLIVENFQEIFLSLIAPYCGYKIPHIFPDFFFRYGGQPPKRKFLQLLIPSIKLPKILQTGRRSYSLTAKKFLKKIHWAVFEKFGVEIRDLFALCRV